MARKIRRRPLSGDELGREQGAELPDREAMSLISPGAAMPPVMSIPPGEIDHPMPIDHPGPTPIEDPTPLPPTTETV